MEDVGNQGWYTSPPSPRPLYFCLKGRVFVYNPSYNSYGYLPSQFGQQSPFQPVPTQPLQPPLQPPQNGPVVLQVGSVKDFDSVTMQPGKQALLMAQNEPFIAFKSADQLGMVTTSLYRIEPVTAEQIATPSPEYVTRQEFEQTIANLTAKPARKQAAKEETE